MIDVNKPIENPELSKLLIEYRNTNNQELLGLIYEEVIMHAHFLMVMTIQQASEMSISEGATLSIHQIIDANGQGYLPLFTDWNSLSLWKDLEAPVQTLISAFEDFTAIVINDEKSQGLVINPFSENFVITKTQLQDFKTQKDIRIKGVSKQIIEKDTQVLIGDPKEVPSEMLSALAKYAKTNASIKRLWLKFMKRNGEQSYLLIVDQEGDMRETSEGLGKCASSHLKRYYLDIISLDSKLTESIKSDQPFYEKTTQRQGVLHRLFKKHS